MNKTIDIGIPIDLQKLLDTRLLIQAGSGGGKSYTLRKTSEAVGNQVQQIIIDPEGEFVTLREKFNFALVGREGDIPLSVKYAETLASKLLETNLSAIIDLYELQQHERILFVKRFLSALVNAPKELWHPCFVLVDEAHIFAPETSQSESLRSVIDLCSRGRKRGFAAILATQRLSKLHKDAAAECLNKMIGRTGLDIDRKRAGEELGMTSKQDMLTLRELQPGEFFAFGPAISNEVTKFKVGQVATTHLQSGKRLVANPPTPNAIKSILSKLSDLPEEAEKELQTKQQLQGEIARLKGELTKNKRLSITSINTPSSKDIERLTSQAKKETADQFTRQIKDKDQVIFQLQRKLKQLADGVGKISGMLAGMDFEVRPVQDATLISARLQPKHPVKRIEKSSSTVRRPDNSGLGKCARAIMQFLSSVPERPFSKVQVAVATGYSQNSGGFNNALSELTSKGLIQRNNGSIGLAEGIDPTAYATEVKEYSVYTFVGKLEKCEREIYEVLLAHPEREYTKEQLAENTPSNYSPNSGGFNNALSSLNTLELIQRSSGRIKLNPELLELM